MAKVNLMTQTEYAKHRGCSGVAVFKAVKSSRISLIDGKIDPSVADIQWTKNTRVRASNRKQDEMPALALAIGTDTPPMVPGGVDDYLVSRSRREAAEASIAEMKEAEMRGKYLLKTDVDAVAFEVARAMRDGLTNCAKRIASDVAGIGNADGCAEVIDREHRVLLENMMHVIGSRLGATDGDSAA